jgi:hypothetical protein
LSQLAKEGKALYGESYMPEHVQDASARNSRHAQLKFSKYLCFLARWILRDIKYNSFFLGAFPWFNFANHNNHGVDTSKYTSSSS